jgi:hypothetical protein
VICLPRMHSPLQQWLVQVRGERLRCLRIKEIYISSLSLVENLFRRPERRGHLQWGIGSQVSEKYIGRDCLRVEMSSFCSLCYLEFVQCDCSIFGYGLGGVILANLSIHLLHKASYHDLDVIDPKTKQLILNPTQTTLAIALRKVRPSLAAPHLWK